MEQQLIQTIKSTLQDPSYIGDDCAVVKIGNENYLFTLDNFVEDIHYRNDYFSATDIGWKSLAVSISDIAAMAGEPLWVLVGLSLAQTISDKESWVRDFYTGLNQCASAFGNPKVIGGDITAAKNQSSISITVIGKATNPLLRKSARPGDLICVTGTFGETGHFLADISLPAPHKHLRPEPRLQEARDLVKLNPQAALMDASDGLAQALFEIAEQSQVDIAIDTSLIPKLTEVTIKQALYGGEDYELVCSCSKLPPGFKIIGKTLSGTGKVNADGQLLRKDELYQHFKV